jgi:nucleosome binding factor SPN SPT16 subunit
LSTRRCPSPSLPSCLQDFSRDVLRIDAIPTKKLDTIRDWLVHVKIK